MEMKETYSLESILEVYDNLEEKKWIENMLDYVKKIFILITLITKILKTLKVQLEKLLQLIH